ncbi:MAG: Tol-Pal system beta propeller repeat protein TolB [Pseudomonadales bacterium]
MTSIIYRYNVFFSIAGSMQICLRQFSCCTFVVFLCLIGTPLHAALNIEIFGGGASQIPIAIVPFAAEEKLKQSVTEVVASDLHRSGFFRLVDSGGLVPHDPRDIVYPNWQMLGANALVIGSTRMLPNGQVEVRYSLMDVARQVLLISDMETVSVKRLRAVAHRMADNIYEKLTGDVGVFSTRIAYVVKKGKKYALQVADADGFNARTAIEYTQPIISLAWSPDGTKIAYVSFENKKPVVHIQTLATGARKAVAKFKGSNSAPAWSPDGKRLAVVLSVRGGSQIFLINADGSGLKRFSRSSGIDTEPSFSPDGQSIIFTSDRGGSPQIYRMPVTGTASRVAERLTFEGNYNVSPHYRHDGKSFTFIHRNGAKFNVAVQDLDTRQVQLLTDSLFDESPSFAPNGKIILYATEIRGRGILAAVSSDGRTRQRLSAQTGDIREPAWGPLPKWR